MSRKVNIDSCLTNPSTDWTWISQNRTLTKEDIQKAKDKLDWYWISMRYSFNEEELRKYADYLNWSWVNLSGIRCNETFFREFWDYVKQIHFLDYLYLSKDFRREFKFTDSKEFGVYKMNYKDACEFVSGKDWDYISKTYIMMNQEFVQKFKDKVNWFYISKNKRYTIRFLKKFAKYLNWEMITREQVADWKDYKIQLFAKYLDWDEIKTWSWKKHNKSFREKFGKRCGWNEQEYEW